MLARRPARAQGEVGKRSKDDELKHEVVRRRKEATLRVRGVLWCTLSLSELTAALACLVPVGGVLGGFLRGPHGVRQQGDLPPGGLRRQVHGPLQAVPRQPLWLKARDAARGDRGGVA